jgi:hypothetical protein
MHSSFRDARGATLVMSLLFGRKAPSSVKKAKGITRERQYKSISMTPKMEVDLAKLAIALIILAIFLIWHFFFGLETEQQKQKRIEDERRKEEQRLERERQKAEKQKEFDQLVSQGMPGPVARAHREFKAENPLPKGEMCYGEDVSPLTYYGYRVGKTRGLPANERHEVIRYVMRARLTDPLAKSYQVSWGRPLSLRRRQAIREHIEKLAAQRGSRPNYEVAVADWRADSEWTANVMQAAVGSLGGYNFK